MGKGKAKGYRPPPPDDPSVGMLYGSADHLTGDTIASPVQLRQEGRPIPEGHPNFGDDFGKGGKGKGGKTPQLVLPRDPNAPRSATGANSIAVAPKAAPGESAAKEEPAGAAGSGSMAPPPLLKAAAKAPPKAAEKPAAPVASSGTSSPTAAKPTPSPSSPSAKAPDSGLSEIERRRAAMTEIERRRAEMLEREKAAQQEQGLAADAPEDDPEARRLAVEARRKQAEARAREAEAKLRQAMAKGPEPSAVVCKDEEVEGDSAAAAGVAEDVPMGVKEEDEGRGGEGEVEEEDEEDEVARAMARRRREEEENGEAVAEDDEEPAAKRPRADGAEGPAPTGGALKMGLQQWAERVNALAGDDPDLAQRCRDFVRRRIVKAHADGNLHAVDWGEEPIPTIEALQAASD